MTEDEIALFQAEFLEILNSTNDRENLDADFQQLRCNEALKAYVSGSDRTMLVLAAMLVKKWGRLR